MEARAEQGVAPRRAALIVVSGLPRSGTSLVMQMLAAGGVPLIVDDARPPDAHNPRGYYELAAVKSLRRDVRFLDDLPGGAIKIVAPLLPALPEGRVGRIVFVTRRIDEVMASQATMLGRAGEAVDRGDEARLAAAFEGAVGAARAWIAARTELESIDVDHAELLGRPHEAASRLAAFLRIAGPGVVDAMAAVVDPSLHRSRVPGAGQTVAAL